MDCNYFENRLEMLVEGALPVSEQRTCATHVAGCPACRELLALASLEPPPVGVADDAWLGEVIARTSGSACAEVEAALCEFVDGGLPAVDRRALERQGVEGQRFESHLAGCSECAALVGALRALALELPRMADVRPDERFVGDVLVRTLPVPVRLRRFWARNWPRWVRRPRFASEVAYVGVLVLLLVFATPGSPLEAVPRKALETVRADRGRGLAAPMAAAGDRLENTLQEWRQGSAGEAATDWYAASEEAVARARVTASELEGRIEVSWGTLRGEIASLLGKDEAPVPEPVDSTKERP